MLREGAKQIELWCALHPQHLEIVEGHWDLCEKHDHVHQMCTDYYFMSLQSSGICTVVVLLKGPRPTVKAAILYW